LLAPQRGLIATGYDTTFAFCRLSGENRKPLPFILDPGLRRDDTLFKKSFPELSNFVGPPAKPGVYLKEINSVWCPCFLPAFPRLPATRFPSGQGMAFTGAMRCFSFSDRVLCREIGREKYL
jgi:hypothetical protein